jgi:cellulose biosynthesis protein BcsQ
MITTTVYSEAGGTFKTTTVSNTAVALSRRGYNVLVIDLDPQEGSLSYVFDVADAQADGKADNLVLHMIDRPKGDFDDLIRSTEESIDVLPAHNMLEDLTSFLDRAAEIEEMSNPDEDEYERYAQLHRVLIENNVQNDYDAILIDPQATASDALYNAIYATRSLVSPVELSGKGKLSLDGLEDLVMNLEDHLAIKVGVVAVVPGNVGQTRANKRYQEELAEQQWSVPVMIGERESLMNEMWDAQGSAFKVIDEAYVDGVPGERRERDHEQETLSKYETLAEHLITEFE